VNRILEKEIPERFKNPLYMLDAHLQFSQNPTSASAGYGIEENYPYIEMNLKKRYGLTSEEVARITQSIKRIFDRMLKVNPDVYFWRDRIKNEILKKEKDLFINWYVSKFEKFEENDKKKFIFLLTSVERSKLLERFYCFFDKEEKMNEIALNNILIEWGLANILFYRSSSGYEKTELVLSLFLPDLREKLKENLYVNRGNIEAFFSKLDVSDIKLVEKCIINDGILENAEGKCLLEEPFLIGSSKSFWAIWPPSMNEFKELILYKKKVETEVMVKAINSILSLFAKENFPLANVRTTLILDGAQAWHLDFASEPNKPPIKTDILVAPWLFPINTVKDIFDEFWSKTFLPHVVFLFFSHENVPTISTRFSSMYHAAKWYTFIRTPMNDFYPSEFGIISEEVKDTINNFLITFLPYLLKELKISTKWKSVTTEKMELYTLLKENPEVLEIVVEGLNIQPIVADFLREGLRRKFGESKEQWKEMLIQKGILGDNTIKEWENKVKNRLYVKDFLDGATFGEIIGIIRGLPELLEDIPTNRELLLSSLNILNKWRKELWGHPTETVAKIHLTKEQYEGIKRALKNVGEICKVR